MPELALTVFFLSIAGFIAVAFDVRRYALSGKSMSQPLLYAAAILGSFGALMGLLLWPVTVGNRKALRPLAPIIVSVVMTVVLVLIPAIC